jgi:Cu/Ag efflux pump CusA
MTLLLPERITQRLRQNSQQGGLASVPAVILKPGETRGAIFFMTLITLLDILPVFIGGINGGLFQPWRFSYVLAVLVP